MSREHAVHSYLYMHAVYAYNAVKFVLTSNWSDIYLPVSLVMHGIHAIPIPEVRHSAINLCKNIIKSTQFLSHTKLQKVNKNLNFKLRRKELLHKKETDRQRKDCL